MGDIIIINIEGPEARKRLKKLMPPQVRAALDQVGRDVDMESGEELREGLAEGFPTKFIVPEEVLVFPPDEEEPDGKKKRRRRMRDLNNQMRRKKLPGNAE
jgi:hypothetical protein